MSSVHLLVISFVLAFCSIVYELLMAKTIAMLTGSTVFWMSVTIGVYIAALGVGTFLYEVRKRKYLSATQKEEEGSLLRTLFRVELSLSLLGILSVAAALVMHIVYRIYIYQPPSPSVSPVDQRLYIAMGCQLLTFGIGLLSGFELPILMDLFRLQHKDSQAHKILGVNYIGALFGSLVFSLLFLPHLDLMYTALVVGLLNLIICFVLWSSRSFSLATFDRVMLPINVASLWALCFFGAALYQLYLKNFYFNAKPQKGLTQLLPYLAQKPRINRIKSLYQNIDITTDTNVDKERFMVLFLDHHFQFHEYSERRYHENMVHIPIQLFQQVPRRVLMLGGGDGLALRELLKYDQIKSITQVELDPTIIRLAREHPVLRRLNKDALKHPKVKVVYNDAFYYLRNHKTQYDAIFIDFPYPYNYDLSKLYSMEFYRFVAMRLKDSGFMVLDSHLTYVPSSYNNVILSSLHFAGFRTLFPYTDAIGDETFVAASKQKRTLSFRFQPYPKVKMHHVNPKHLSKLQKLKFPFRLHRKYINSIFHPKLLNIADPLF